MTDPLTFDSNATKAETIGAKLAASDAFARGLADPNGVNGTGAVGAAQSSTPAATEPQSAPERHIVPGVGATPPKLPEHAGKSPYEHLASLLGAPQN